jgi:hypothetical protein
MRGKTLCTLLLIGMAYSVVSGCASNSESRNAEARQTQVKRNRPVDESTQLQESARKLWTARVNEDWETVFKFEDPNVRKDWDKDEFITWSKENEPFLIQSFELGRVQADDGMGWVEVNYNTLIRRFESLPPRAATLWQKWRKVDGSWHPVPLRELVSYPEPPARRNAAEEALLRERFMESWAAREQGDLLKVYQFIDPYDREKLPEQAFVDMESLLEYLSCDVKWVEAVGRMGRIHVVYTRKVTDPNLSKLPIETVRETEDWININGVWYRDLARAVGPNPGETHDAS